MSNDAEGPVSDLTVLMRVLDIIERRIEFRDLQNNQSIPIAQLSQFFLPGTVIGSLVGGSINAREVVMGNRFEAHGHAQVGNMGHNASISNISFGSSSEMPADLDLDRLIIELKEVRAEMRRLAGSTDEDEAVVAVGKALEAAEKRDASSVGRHLEAAGKWALGVATTIGTGVAVAAMKAAAGL